MATGQNSEGGQRVEGKDLRTKVRQPLQDVIPLSTPFLLYVDITNLCNFRCGFCPTGDEQLLKKVKRPKGSMTLELFRKMVDDMKEFDRKFKHVNLYKDGEPLLNRHFPEMIRLMRDANVVEKLWTKTNGALLNPEMNARLIDAGLDMIGISVEAVSESGYKRIANADLDYSKFLENIRDLYARRGKCEIYIKIANSGLSQAEIDKFYADFQPISTYVGIESLTGWSNSNLKDFTLGTNPTTFDGLPLCDKDVCAYPFYELAVNFNGTVSVCNEDWSHATIVGDITKNSLKEIWNGEPLFRFQEMLLEGRRKENLACGDCYYLRTVPDNIDAYRAAILAKIRKSRGAG